MRTVTRFVAWSLVCIGAAAPWAHAATDPGDLPPWQVPDVATLPNDDNGRAVRYGRDLIASTSALIGPDAADPRTRYAGNGLDCQNCHLGAGTQRFALPFLGIWSAYPAFSARVGGPQTIADRINDCMERSMNGRALPTDGPEILAMQAYIRFLGTGQATEGPPVGRGAPPLPLPTAAADPVHGADVYQARCAACHQPDGAGERYSPSDAKWRKQRYVFPPVWGSDSYNDAAGMARNITAAWFVHANMPLGGTFAYPLLKTAEAYDVIAYINGQPRPHKSGLERDYPDRWLKPADATYPPLLGPFSKDQHELGPWQPIEARLREQMPPDRAGERSGGDLEAVIGTPADADH